MEMEIARHKTAPWLVAWVACWLTTPALDAENLGEKTLLDATKTSAAQWQTAPGITVAITDNLLIVRSGEVDYGWASAGERVPVDPAATVNLMVQKVSNGQLGVQIEWFGGDGKFLGFTNVLQQVKSTAVTALNLGDVLPKAAKPTRFGLKFWIEGRHAEGSLARAVVQAPLAFRNAETRLAKAYKPGTKTTSDKGVQVKSGDGVIGARLDAESPYSGFVLEERAGFDPKGVVLVNLENLQGGVFTVQALCWNKDGTFLKAVDLIKDAAEAGVMEAAFELFAGEFPADAAQVSFKVWLTGKEASAKLGGLYYGVAP